MKDIDQVFIGVLARTICGGTDCEQCHEIFDTDECPCDLTNHDDQKELAETLLRQMKNAKYYDLGPCAFDKPWDVDDILQLLEDCKEK